MLKVKQVFDDSEQRFGAEKIRVTLAKSGIHVSTKRISAIMQELGLCSVRTDAKKQFKRKQQYAKQNLLKREFSADHPNQVWVSDFTYFKVKSYWVYLCIILDLYSRKIVGWRVSRHMSTHLVTATFKATFQERGKPPKSDLSQRPGQPVCFKNAGWDISTARCEAILFRYGQTTG